MSKIITFEEEAKAEVLNLFNKAVDEEGYIVEKDNPAQRIPGSDGEALEVEHFAGIKKGSLVFIKSDLISLIELADSLEKHPK